MPLFTPPEPPAQAESSTGGGRRRIVHWVKPPGAPREFSACLTRAAARLFSVPPAPREEPRDAGQHEEDADAEGDDARRDVEAVERLARGVVRGREHERQEHHLGGEDAPAEGVL